MREVVNRKSLFSQDLLCGGCSVYCYIFFFQISSCNDNFTRFLPYCLYPQFQTVDLCDVTHTPLTVSTNPHHLVKKNTLKMYTPINHYSFHAILNQCWYGRRHKIRRKHKGEGKPYMPYFNQSFALYMYLYFGVSCNFDIIR